MHVKNANAPSERARGEEGAGKGGFRLLSLVRLEGWRHGIVGMHDGNKRKDFRVYPIDVI